MKSNIRKFMSSFLCVCQNSTDCGSPSVSVSLLNICRQADMYRV